MRVQYLKSFLFADDSQRRFAFLRSMDAKTALRLGTDVGFRGARKKIMFPLSPAALALPKYDYPIPARYVTPASHKLISKRPIVIEGTLKLVTDNDSDVVYVRPKYVVSDSASVWATETMDLLEARPYDFCCPEADGNFAWSLVTNLLFISFLTSQVDSFSSLPCRFCWL